MKATAGKRKLDGERERGSINGVGWRTTTEDESSIFGESEELKTTERQSEDIHVAEQTLFMSGELSAWRG